MRPFRHLRIIDSFTTNRYHDTGFGALTEQILLSPTVARTDSVYGAEQPQVVNYNQQQVEAIYELTPKLIMRGGYR